jgi:hypothetical protein
MSASETEGTLGFMRDLEARYQRLSGLFDRSLYKIFYCQVRPAPILTLGINPGGSPADMNPDGLTQKNGTPAAASGSFHENGEHDVLDCEWKENTGLRRLIAPLVGNDVSRIREEVVKTNLAFRRSARKTDIDMAAAMSEAKLFLGEILDRVRPNLILLTGVPISDFTSRYARQEEIIEVPQRDPGVKQVVFAASRVTLDVNLSEVLVVRVAHASQFSWTYDRYHVGQRILALQSS